MKTEIHVGLDSWREATPEEIALIDAIVAKEVRAHCEYACFCDARNNLYALQIQTIWPKVGDSPTERNVDVVFIRSHASHIWNSKPEGYYEAEGPVYDPLTELFHHYPKVDF